MRDHWDIAADLARRFSADRTSLNQHFRPTPRFSYLCSQLVDPRTGRVTADVVVEIKSRFESTAPRGWRKASLRIWSLGDCE